MNRPRTWICGGGGQVRLPKLDDEEDRVNDDEQSDNHYKDTIGKYGYVVSNEQREIGGDM